MKVLQLHNMCFKFAFCIAFVFTLQFVSHNKYHFPPARYSCIKCHASHTDYQTGTPGRPRSIETIKADYQNFVDNGSRVSKSKEVSHSVIAEPMLPIDIEHVRITGFELDYVAQLPGAITFWFGQPLFT